MDKGLQNGLQRHRSFLGARRRMFWELADLAPDSGWWGVNLLTPSSLTPHPAPLSRARSHASACFLPTASSLVPPLSKSLRLESALILYRMKYSQIDFFFNYQFICILTIMNRSVNWVWQGPSGSLDFLNPSFHIFFFVSNPSNEGYETSLASAWVEDSMR